mmetsp:Transcript_45267/g.105645  ORF Transcript_45267/g.105645 Transcript_45267/m.105645 type:complete len:404 (+) Transcript_45267:36-1247(+)
MAQLSVLDDADSSRALWRLKVAIATIIFCLSVSAVPIYNKLVFANGVCDGNECLRRFPYPMATAFLQLLLVATVLGIINVAGHFCDRSKSWLFGPHFRYKLRHIAPVGVLFGLKYGVTNWGLQLVPVGIHLLLQSTDVIWTILLAEFANHEDLGLLEVVAAVLSAGGSALIGLHAADTLQAPLVPLLVNILPPFLLALCVSTLRMGAKELFRPDNRLGGTVTPTEFTSIKLILSSLTALVLSILHEGPAPGRPSWWEALAEEPPAGVVLMLLGGVFVLIFQVNLTWLVGLTSVATVGIIGGVKVVPQWILNALFQFKVDLNPLNLGGAALVILATSLYAYANYRAAKLVIKKPDCCCCSSSRWKKQGLDSLEERLLETASPLYGRRCNAPAALLETGVPTTPA